MLVRYIILHRRRAVFIPLVLVPVGQHLGDPRRVRQSVDILKILSGDLKRLSCHVGYILAHQLAWVNCRPVDVLQQERPERFDARAQESAMEGNVDAAQWDGREASLQLQGLGLRLGELDAFGNDLDQMSLDVLK